MARLTVKEVENPVVKYLGFQTAAEVAKAFNAAATCPLCVEVGDMNHDPEACYAHISYTVDILGHSGEYGHLFEG